MVYIRILCLFSLGLQTLVGVGQDDVYIRRVSHGEELIYSIFCKNVLQSQFSTKINHSHSVSVNGVEGHNHGPTLTYSDSVLKHVTVYNEGMQVGPELMFSYDGGLYSILSRDSLGYLHGPLYEFMPNGDVGAIYLYEHDKFVGLLFHDKRHFVPIPNHQVMTPQDSTNWRLNVVEPLVGPNN